MLEILFSDSAAGSMKVGMGRVSEIGGCIGIIATDENGRPLPPEETARLQREAEERIRRDRARALPLDGDPRDILSFPLALSVGPIDEEGIGPLREETLERLCALYPQGAQAAREMLTAARRHLETVLARAPKEPVRLWADHTPDAACGLRWLLEQLRPLGFDHLDLRVVVLPDLSPQDGGGLVRRQLGEIGPAEWGRLAQQARPLPADQAAALAGQWQVLKRENAPLRAVLNGVLVSAPETLYDPYLQRVLDEQEETFSEAMLIGRTLGRFPLGFGDAWLDLRVEQWIADGKLAVVTLAAPDMPRYHRQLRKVCV